MDRRVFRVKTPCCERPDWPLAVLALFGGRGATVIREFLMETGRERLGHWDYAAEQAIGRALASVPAAEAEPA